MFFLSLIEHKLRLPPHLLSLPLPEAIKQVLDDIFLDKVIANLGLCVSIYDIRDISGGFIQAGEGAPTYTVEFRMVVFRLFTGEIIVAKIIESDTDGLRLSLGFFDDIYIPAHQLPQPCHQIPDPDRRYKVRWIWEYDMEETGKPEEYNIDGLDEVKLQVLNMSFPPLPIEQQEKPFAPMLVTFTKQTEGDRNRRKEMFFLSLIEHKLRLPPHLLSLPLPEAIKQVLDDIFLDKVIANLGLCVSIYDIRDISGGFVQSGEGAPTYTVEFRMVVFRPFTGEIIVAKIIESDTDGLRLSFGFFDDIYIPAHQLPQPCHQIPDPDRRYKVRWIWEYDMEETGKPEEYNIDGLDEVKLQVLNVSFPPLPIEQQEKPFAPMLVTVNVAEAVVISQLILRMSKWIGTANLAGGI